jgi:hypothetical protein
MKEGGIMIGLKRVLVTALGCIAIFGTANVYALGTNPIISRGTGVTVKVSSGDATAINNNKWGQYETKKWTVSDDSWIAIKLGATYPQVFITWSSPDSSWSDKIGISKDSCNKTVQYPTEYEILTSANSTTGADGDWTKAISITGNEVGARGHMLPFTGMSWIKLHITKGKGTIDEVEVFDATHGMPDSWFFLGTKITAVMMKGKMSSGYTTDKNVPDSNFAAMINMRNKTFTPAVIRGGINCAVHSGDVVRDISKYLDAVGNVTFWAIELGTYDCWGGKSDSLAAFKKNLQVIVDSCKAHKIHPIFARIPGTVNSKTKWQIPADYLKAIDDLAKSENLLGGADLYTYNTTGTGSYDVANDGILPNDYGDFELQREWAKKMDTVVYKGTVMVNPSLQNSRTMEKPKVVYKNGRLVANGDCAGSVAVFSINGEMIRKIALRNAGTYPLGNKAAGVYLVKFASEKGLVETIPVLNR